MKKIIDFLKDEEGVALPEYALLVALIAVLAIGAITLVGKGVSNKMTTVSDQLK